MKKTRYTESQITWELNMQILTNSAIPSHPVLASRVFDQLPNHPQGVVRKPY
jgi:hypothetical protein